MELTGGTLLARNAAWSVAGELVPIAAALFAIPLLVRGFGTDRFGVLSLAWALIGYFSVLELGLGKALTRAVASRLGQGRSSEIPALVATALLMTVLLGVAGGAVFALVSSRLAGQWLRIPPGLRAEALTCFRLLAAAVPVVTAISGLRGVLEAQQRMRLLLAIRLPVGVLSYVAPLVALPFSASLVPAVAILVGLRVASLAFLLAACRTTLPRRRHPAGVTWSAAAGLLRFGGWMTVSNVLIPLLSTLDRFVVGATVSVAAIAYYSVPLDAVQYAGVVPGAIATVLFPAFTTSFVRDRTRTAALFAGGLKVHLALMFPCALALAAFGRDGLRLWLGTEFARQGAPVIRWVAVGLFVSSLARVAFWLVQAAGRPDLPARFHLLETVVYLPILWWATRSFGIAGAAAAWTGRVVLDAVLLFGASRRIVPLSRTDRASLAAISGAALAALALFPEAASAALRVGAVAITAAAFGAVYWRRLLSEEERRWLRALPPPRNGRRVRP